MNHPEAYAGKRVVILGLAKSGQAVAKLFHRLGANVTVNDRKERKDCPEADDLERLGIHVICGGHPETLIDRDVALIVKNPGIPYHIPPAVKAAEMGIEMVSEVEVAYHLCRVPLIGITGSNGKTTTTTWVGKILERAHLHPTVAGNIGTPLCEAVLGTHENGWAVAELSSFQLKGTCHFRPRIACILNVCETHLDYHGTMEDYIASKAKLLANQTDEDTAVLNWDDPVCRELASSARARILPFSMKEALDVGVFIRRFPPETAAAESGEVIVYRDFSGREHTVLPVKELGIPGRHNVENALAATAVCAAAGADVQNIAEVLHDFKGVEHRLEYVATVRGVRFYNDSKATNPLATLKALDAFAQPVILIAGGLDRGQNFNALEPALKEKVKVLVTLGETSPKLQQAAERAGVARAAVDPLHAAEDALDEAVRLAFSRAGEGDVVLLSPACASWDMFKSYEERGSMFKKSVHNLL
jgi:UDP-N-acetylmuramoylalanine--D-glutamate ligase